MSGTGIELLLGNLFGSVIGGSPIFLGLIGLLILIILGVAFRLSFEGFLVILLPAFFLFALAGFFPAYIYYGIIVVCGLIIGFAMLMIVSRHG